MNGARGPYPDDTFDGCYVNHCDSDLADWQFLYYKGNYSRLQTAKYQWEQSIEPLSAPAQDG